MKRYVVKICILPLHVLYHTYANCVDTDAYIMRSLPMLSSRMAKSSYIPAWLVAQTRHRSKSAMTMRIRSPSKRTRWIAVPSSLNRFQTSCGLCSQSSRMMRNQIPQTPRRRRHCQWNPADQWDSLQASILNQLKEVHLQMSRSTSRGVVFLGIQLNWLYDQMGEFTNTYICCFSKITSVYHNVTGKTRNNSDCDPSNYSSWIILSHIPAKLLSVSCKSLG